MTALKNKGEIMPKKSFCNVVSVLMIMSFMLHAKIPIDKNNPIVYNQAVLEWKFFDVNTINCTINSAGPYCDYLRTNSSGLYWPKGTSKTAVFTAGIWVIGKHQPTGQLRTAVQNYQTEFQPGTIDSIYNTTTNSTSVLGDPTDPKFKIYKVARKDSLGGNPDYDEWPVELGAPYTDINNDGKYTAGTDKPYLWGDQVLWCVYNDGNPVKHNNTGLTKPMGIEIQSTYFGFDQPGALGNVMFMRWKIINKSDADYDSVFISMWSDTDLGDANDDMVGCDTVRNLAYVYNGDNDDGGASGYGSKPPANGFIFLQGPKVSGLFSDTALFEGKKLPGYKNLPATSHVTYSNQGVDWDDPLLVNLAFAERAYNYQNGLVGKTAQPYVNPHTGHVSKFVFPGDPVSNTGWTQSSHPISQGDVRSMISSGPFTLAKGDTQEIVGGFIIAQGADRLNSISILRSYVDIAQSAFNANFNSSILSIEKPEDGNIPNAYSLFQNYPNPFNPTTTIHYRVPKQSKVVLSVFNIVGQKVATLVNDIKDGGYYSAEWDGRNDLRISMPSGLYFYRLSTDNYSATKKMLLLK